MFFRSCSATFQSTPSAWRVTQDIIIAGHFARISIHTLRMEGDLAVGVALAREVWISIHTLRMEGDGKLVLRHLLLSPISIHTLRMEGDCREG